METVVYVPMQVVKILELEPAGINPILDDLRENHRIQASYDGRNLQLQGLHKNILDIAIDHLKNKTGLGTYTNKTLEGKGRVTCTYTGKVVTHIQHLFKSERQELLKIESVQITNQPNMDSLVISCGYQDYDTVNEMFDKKINECKEKMVKVDAKDVTLAEQFEKDKSAKSCYCSLNIDKKDKSKTKLYFYGRTEKDCEEGVSAWEKVKKGNKNTSTSISTTVWHVQGIESKSGAKQDSKISEKHEVKTSDEKNNATVRSNYLQKAKPSDNAETVLACAKVSSFIAKKGDAGWNENTPTTSSKEMKKTPGRMKGSGDTAIYFFQIEDTNFYVYKESITEIKGMDAITNAANEKLIHGGGMAYYVSKAAGKQMDQDCRNFIDKKGSVSITENYISHPGNIKCKGIIHAVGPSWFDYRDRKDDCARDLYMTIKNVLIAAKSKEWQKVALSAISSGLFGVPKKLCAEMYIKAFADVATEVGGTVKEVHFIDINREILDLVIEAHRTWMEDPSKLDFKNALKFKRSMSENQAEREAETNKQASLIQFLGTDRTTYGETRYKYCVCKELTVFVYKGSLTRLETVDGIVLAISPDRNQMGVLEHSVRILAGSNYTREVDKFRNGKNGNVFVSNETGRVKCKHIIHVISASVRSLDEVAQSTRYDIYRLALTFNYNSNIRSLGIPLFGSAWASNKRDMQTLCYNLVQTLLSVCCDSSKQMNIKEVHLVNLDHDISSCLQEEFGKLSKSIKDPEQKWNYKKSTFYTKPNATSMAESRFWKRHTPIEKGSTAKVKSVDNRICKGKDNHEMVLATEKAPSNGKCEYCLKPATPMNNSNSCMKCSAKSNGNKMDSNQANEDCPICLEPLRKAEELPCSHKLCETCFQKIKKSKPQCPVCQHIFGIVTGNQPEGDMFYRHVAWKSVQGYEGCGTIEICYQIPRGKQEEYHPNPNKPYKGIERRAYLPDNKEGNEVLYLLIKAFDRKLIFTIGESRTTGKEDVVTWNDIHHKTNMTGGPQRFGYPDPTYLVRVREELAAKGVTE